MRHPDKIEKYNGTIDELAKDITNLRYDILAQLLDKLSHNSVSYTHLRAHETPEHLVCRLLLEKKKTTN